MPQPPVHPPSPDRRAGWGLFAGIAVIYFFSAKGYLEVTDTLQSVRTADAILTRGHLDVPCEPEATFRTADGRCYSKYGIGLPVYFLPWVAAGRLAAEVMGRPAEEMTGFFVSF